VTLLDQLSGTRAWFSTTSWQTPSCSCCVIYAPVASGPTSCACCSREASTQMEKCEPAYSVTVEVPYGR
jgi:hypothetical protein